MTESRHTVPLVALALALITLAVFWQISDAAFINFDDNSYVSENRFVLTGLSFSTFIAAFTETFNGHWHPFTMLSYMVDSSVFGPTAGGFHLTNLLLHILNVILLFFLLRELTGALWPSALAAALFAIHPLHVESVAWIASRKDVLSTLFLLLFFFAYSGYVREPSRARYIVMTVWLLCGLLSKAMLVTAPAVLLLLDIWPLNRYAGIPNERAAYLRRVRELVLEKVPLFALAFLFSIITVATQSSAGAMSAVGGLPIHLRIANALYAYGMYLLKLVFPVGLAPFYPHNGEHAPLIFAGISAAVLIWISFVAVITIRRAPYIFVGWFWFVGTLLPVSGLMQAGIQAYADRYTYVSYIGLFIALVWTVAHLVHARPQLLRPVTAIAAALLVVCSTLTWMQVGRWRNDITLFEHTLRVTDDNYVANMILGNAYYSEGRVDEAIEQYTEALIIEPNDVTTYTAMGVALAAQGQFDAAEKAFETALQLDPNHALTHAQYGALFLRRGNIEAAASHFEVVLEIVPDNLMALNGLGLARAYQGELASAEQHLQEGIKLAPYSLSLHKDLALVLAQQGKRQEALSHFTKAALLDPSDADTHNNLAIVLSEEQQFEDAIRHFNEALRLDPEHATAQANLERCLLAQKQGQAASFPGNP